MKNSDFIIEWVENLKIQMNEIPHIENDIRKDFFGLLCDSAYCYYRPYLLFEIADLTNQKKLDFGVLKDNKHIKAIEALGKRSTSRNSQIHSLDRNFVLDTWSTFEICITTFCDGVCTNSEIDKLLSHKFAQVKNKLPKNKLSPSDLVELKSKLINQHLTHVPIVRKTDLLYKKANGYSRDIKEDKEFLSFFGRLRNTMHSNYIFYGNASEYSFRDAIFKFDNGETVKWHDPFQSTPKLFFYLVENLKDIWKELTDSIKWEEVIYYPNLNTE